MENRLSFRGALLAVAFAVFCTSPAIGDTLAPKASASAPPETTALSPAESASNTPAIEEKSREETPVAAPRPTQLPTPVLPVGPSEADFEKARAIRDAIIRFKSEKESVLAAMGERREAVESELQTLSGELDSIVAGTRDADAYHARVVAALKVAREDLDAALDDLNAPSAAPSIAIIEEVSTQRLSPSASEWIALSSEIEELRQQAIDLENQVRWANVAIAGDRMQILTAIRAVSFDRQSLDRRSVLLGTGREGLEQLTREFAQLVLIVRYYVAAREHAIVDAPKAVGDVFAIGGTMIVLLKLALVLAIAFFVRSRWGEWLNQARVPLFRSLRTVAGRRRLERALAFLEITGPWLLLFLTLYFVEWAVGPWMSAFEVKLSLTMLYYYAAYRLSIDLVVATALSVSTRYELRISAARRDLIHSSVVLFFRVVFGLAVFKLLSKQLLGGGYLHLLARHLAGTLVAITLLFLMLKWRRELADAFLSKHSEGKIADLVRRTRDSWIGVLVAPASFGWILGRAAAVLARDFAMGFEQTQRALAFLFRKRIEKEAERRGYAAGELETLPQVVREVFTEEAIERGPELLEHFPGLDRLRETLSESIDRGVGGSFLLTGERGTGKTTWLRRIRRDDVQVDRIELGIRVTTRDSFTELLASQLALQETTFEGVVDCLTGGEPRVIILDNAQHLFLATVGGYEAWEAFADLVSLTKGRVFWVAAMSAYAWKQLSAVRSDVGVFADQEHLTSWNEERIRELLKARIEASGVYFNYSSLVVDALEGVSSREHLIESAEGYARLLWDYADGNPRVAIHYFLRSLDAESENRMRVRLFRAPEVDRLEKAGETALFILACIVTHESISHPHIAEATRYSGEICRIHLDRFIDDAVVSAQDGLHRITTHWHRAAVRTLKRRNILTV